MDGDCTLYALESNPAEPLPRYTLYPPYLLYATQVESDVLNNTSLPR